MKNNQLSKTFTYLYHHIIEDLLYQIYYNNNNNYTVKTKFGNDDLPIALEKKFEEYKEKALQNMVGERLDRHKLASCICGAIIELRPIVGVKGKKFSKTVNELFALHVGFNVIKAYMIYELIYKPSPPLENEKNIKEYLKNNFHIQLPCEKICDAGDYQTNLVNTLYQTHQQCGITGENCFKYDILAYSKIFYHLELYNRENFDNAYQDYIEIYNKESEQDI